MHPSALPKEVRMKDTLRQVLVVLSVLATLVVNALAEILPFNGVSTAQISDSFHVYFVPAGYVFSIWGLIYIGLIAYAVFQALPSQRENPRLRQTGWLVAVSGLANMAWLFLWHYLQIPLTVVVMLALLAVLILVYLKLGIGESQASAAETWAVRVPFSVYLGWITVATIANVTDLLYFWSWDGFGISARNWTLVLFVAVLVIAGLMSLTRRDVAYNLVIIWALVGIAVKQAAAKSLVIGSLTVAVLVLAVLTYSLVRQPAPAPTPLDPPVSTVKVAALRKGPAKNRKPSRKAAASSKRSRK
jgi:translocator protein